MKQATRNSNRSRTSKGRNLRSAGHRQGTLFPEKPSRQGIGGRPTNQSKGLGASTSHRTRIDIKPSEPVHVTIRLVAGLPRLRRNGEWQVLRGCFRAALEREGFRLCHYSVMSNHLHLIVEADDRSALARGMQSLQIRIARRLNKFWGRKGRVFNDRYHTQILRSPQQARNALNYVLNNARRHGLKLAQKLDRFASGGWFRGWRERDRITPWPDNDRLVDKSRSWLLRSGWRKQKNRPKPHGGLTATATPTMTA